jgi:hypothetical protein
MTAIICAIALTLTPAPQYCQRGGHAVEPVPRGGHATLVPQPVGDVAAWICIHEHEGAWNDPDDPYWGGLQMDRSFMETWGADMIRKYGGWANRWSPRDQMVVAQRAYMHRGYEPWPETSRACGLSWAPPGSYA